MSAGQNETTDPNGTKGFVAFVRKLFAVDQVDFVQATANIKKDVSFKGFNIWILICSILICSLGLNLNSTAIIIGAMLISPLMGPINGLGLAVGTYDRALLRKSLINLGVATVVSILTATVFFKITPTADNLHELFSRKQPIVLDLFVAFFGGIAGILAASRCINTNVVPGVAIATALMPPLCTAGYGLATLQMDYFLGAFYLFFMNCVMICLAAALIVLYLKYPKYFFVHSSTRRKVKNGIIAFVVLVSVPSVILYYKLLNEGIENKRIQEFVDKEFKPNRSIYVTNFEKHGHEIKVIVSGKYLEPSEVSLLQNRLINYQLNDYTLVVYQNESGVRQADIANMGEQVKVDLLADLYERNEAKLQNKEDEIAFLRDELGKVQLEHLANDKLHELVKSQYNIKELAVNDLVYAKDGLLDTVATALVRWDENLSSRERNDQREKLEQLLKIQLDRDLVRVFEIN